MNIATPTAIGTPMAIAMMEETTVPKNTAAIPKTAGLPCGFQVWVVKMFPVFSVNAGIAFQIRKIAIAAMITSSSPPEPAARALNTRSPIRIELPEIPPSAFRPSGVRPPVERASSASGSRSPMGSAPGTPSAATWKRSSRLGSCSVVLAMCRPDLQVSGVLAGSSDVVVVLCLDPVGGARPDRGGGLLSCRANSPLSKSTDALHRGDDLGLNLRRQRRGTQLVKRSLAIGRGVAQERLEQRADVGGIAGRADDLVGDQDDRVGTRR